LTVKVADYPTFRYIERRAKADNEKSKKLRSKEKEKVRSCGRAFAPKSGRGLQLH
jgi:hypothetical protein